MDSIAYQAKYRIVRKALHELDPYQLLEQGAPIDEFDREAGEIARLINSQSTVLEIANAFAKVLNTAFDASDDTVIYLSVAESIHTTLHTNT